MVNMYEEDIVIESNSIEKNISLLMKSNKEY
jgi:hypothetical protein